MNDVFILRLMLDGIVGGCGLFLGEKLNSGVNRAKISMGEFLGL